LLAFARGLFKHPLRLLKAVSEVIWIGRDRPAEVIKNLAVLPLALHYGELGQAHGITHWHGHWANIPTTACWYLQQIQSMNWSAAIHGEDIFSANAFLAHKLNQASFGVVCSGYFCTHLQTQMNLAEPEKMHLNYHGIDPRVLQRASANPFATPPPGEVLRLISIGRLVPTKGHDVLIKACARLRLSGRDVQLQIIGSGPAKDALLALAEREGVSAHVSLLGALPFEEVLQSLEKSHLFCLAPRLLPGHPPDGIPNVLAEAMALGIPVVTTRVSAIPELVTDKVTGRLVEVDDDAGLAQAVAELVDDPQLTQTYATAALERVSILFDQEANIDELLEHFRQHVPGKAVV